MVQVLHLLLFNHGCLELVEVGELEEALDKFAVKLFIGLVIVFEVSIEVVDRVLIVIFAQFSFDDFFKDLDVGLEDGRILELVLISVFEGSRVHLEEGQLCIDE